MTEPTSVWHPVRRLMGHDVSTQGAEATPRCVPLSALGHATTSGKARSLCDLRRHGLEVPDAFVVIDATPGNLPADLAAAYDALGGGKVAVRSSASDEDGREASFAGQYLTLLDVEGLDALRSSIERCLTSMHSAHADAYRSARTAAHRPKMDVVVQRMVPARAAGVAFTADPVSGRRDRMVIDAVTGLGEELVSGRATPDHFVFDPHARIVSRAVAGASPCLDDATLHRVAEGALAAARSFGTPLDLEWAIDGDGSVRWLQARPITTLPADLRELDAPRGTGDVFTKCNIGEMMPGAVTPLTWSITGHGIDRGMQWMYEELGVHDPSGPGELRYVGTFFGHLFLNLSRLADIISVPGSTASSACLAICGRPVPEVVERPSMLPLRKKLGNGARFLHMTTHGSEHVAALERIVAAIAFPDAPDARSLYRSIDARVPDLVMAYARHLASSTASGALATVFLGILAKGGVPSESHHALVAALLTGANDVESHDIAAGIDRIVGVFRTRPDDARRFLALSAGDALVWLRSSEAGEIGEMFAAYLARHGHRAVRELELRQPEWAQDPSPVIASMQAALTGWLARGRTEARGPARRKAIPWKLRPLVGWAHASVRQRERSKSLLVRATAKFKEAYRRLGAKLVEEGTLDDPDLVYFLTHAELGVFVDMPDDVLVQRAEARRRALPLQMKLDFPDVFVGEAEPLDVVPPSGGGRSLVGAPVSCGVARGRARVARTIDEARLLEPGEILIAPITDVGWTPYFGVIAGLATDIGSAVSHGAVVAREYGLPAIVNLRQATTFFRTGDMVVLDADRGILELDEDGARRSE